MVDVNVNFQDTVRLVEKLIELRKENWEVAPYPVEDHGFEREESWADEYKRILKLFTENLRPDIRTISTKPGARRRDDKQPLPGRTIYQRCVLISSREFSDSNIFSILCLVARSLWTSQMPEPRGCENIRYAGELAPERRVQ